MTFVDVSCLCGLGPACRCAFYPSNFFCCVCAFFLFFFFFFFSSRRRHTRSLCDWSSDVCSSDLRLPTSRISGSSALAMALIGALNRLVGNRYDERKFITIAANIETTVIKVPAGFQDYYPAFYGSTSCVHFRADGIEREHLSINEDELERRFVICYTGEPRLSGINNWDSFKRHIDGDAELFGIFERIRDAAVRMRAALLANDWDEVAATMRAAYPVRKRLAPGITTPQMDMLVERALGNGAEAA